MTLIARTPEPLEEVADAARQHGVVVRVAAADVRDEPAIDAIFDGAARRPIDLLVTAAGINRPGPLVSTPVSAIAEMLEVNVLGTLVACRAFARNLLATRRPGAIVCMSSQMGVVGYPGRAPYCATKHAVNGLTKALALEWATHPIRVNAVAPTFVETPLTAPMLAEPAFRDAVIANIPLGRIGQVDDVDGAVLFLLSDESRFVTGHVLAVDGGWTAI